MEMERIECALESISFMELSETDPSTSAFFPVSFAPSGVLPSALSMAKATALPPSCRPLGLDASGQRMRTPSPSPSEPASPASATSPSLSPCAPWSPPRAPAASSSAAAAKSWSLFPALEEEARDDRAHSLLRKRSLSAAHASDSSSPAPGAVASPSKRQRCAAGAPEFSSAFSELPVATDLCDSPQWSPFSPGSCASPALPFSPLPMEAADLPELPPRARSASPADDSAASAAHPPASFRSIATESGAVSPARIDTPTDGAAAAAAAASALEPSAGAGMGSAAAVRSVEAPPAAPIARECAYGGEAAGGVRPVSVGISPDTAPLTPEALESLSRVRSVIRTLPTSKRLSMAASLRKLAVIHAAGAAPGGSSRSSDAAARLDDDDVRALQWVHETPARSSVCGAGSRKVGVKSAPAAADVYAASPPWSVTEAPAWPATEPVSVGSDALSAGCVDARYAPWDAPHHATPCGPDMCSMAYHQQAAAYPAGGYSLGGGFAAPLHSLQTGGYACMSPSTSYHYGAPSWSDHMRVVPPADVSSHAAYSSYPHSAAVHWSRAASRADRVVPAATFPAAPLEGAWGSAAAASYGALQQHPDPIDEFFDLAY